MELGVGEDVPVPDFEALGGVHTDAPAADVQPRGHAVQAAAPAKEYVLTSQGCGLVEPAMHFAPAGHVAGPCGPSTALGAQYVPAGQFALSYVT